MNDMDVVVSIVSMISGPRLSKPGDVDLTR